MTRSEAYRVSLGQFSVLFAFIAIYHKRHVAPPPATHFWVFFSSCYFLSAFYVQMPVGVQHKTNAVSTPPFQPQKTQSNNNKKYRVVM